MSLSLSSTLELSNGVQMPLFGFGTYLAKGELVRSGVVHAIRTGYPLVDTACIYRNEADVGQGIADSKIARKDLFVTTKLWIDDFGYDAALAAVDTSLGKLGLEHVDLYIPHWPGAKNKGPYDAEANAALRWETWRAMEKIYADKKARAIGVSNYTVAHLKELLAHEDIKVKPMVNQVELHVLLQQTELRKFCAEQGIVVQSYSTLGKGEDRVLRADAVTKIAEEHKKSNAQVLLRWCIQSGIPTIPKSVHDTRIEENADIFDFSLTEANMAALKTIDTETHITWDPTTVP